jgi:chromosome segregation ATPase
VKVALWVPWRRFKAELDELREAIAELQRRELHAQLATGAVLHELQEEVRKMPTRQEWDDAVEKLSQSIADETTQVTNEIQKLRDQIAAGSPITDADLQRVQQLTQSVANIDPDSIEPPGGRKH